MVAKRQGDGEMMGKAYRVSGAVVGIPVLAVLIGCTGSDALPPSSGRLEVQHQNTSAFSSRFERAQVTLAALEVKPVDPLAGQITPEPLSLLQGGVALSLASTTTVTVGTSELAAGTYRLTHLQFVAPLLEDTNYVTPGAGTCDDKIAKYPDPGFNADFTTFSPEITFEVKASGPNAVELELDGQALANAFIAAYTCVPNCTGLNNEDSCTGAFDNPGFAAQFPGFFTIH